MYGLCADTHFHAWSLFASQDEDGVNTRLKGTLREFRRMCETVSKAGGERVYIAGDTFHVRGNIKPSVMNPTVSEMIGCATYLDLEIRIMPGNHDLEGKEVTFSGSSIIPLANATGECQDVMIIQQPHFFDDDMVAIVPWQSTREGLISAIKDLSKSIIKEGHDLDQVDLHLHTGINGVIIGMPDHAWAPEELAQFGFKRVFCGHYHHHKVFEIKDCQVVSIGSLTHQTWSSVGTISGWIMVTDDVFEHNETKAPKFMDFSDDHEIEDFEGNYVRVRGIELDEKEIRQLKQGLEDAGAKGVVIHAIAKSKVTTRSGGTPGKSVKMETSITDWITANEDITGADEKSVADEAMDVLSMARSS